MQLDISDAPAATLRTPFLNLRWGGIFAGLAVGVATQLLLMLFGAAVGLAAFEVGETSAESAMPLAASVWNAAGMVVAAFVGGYVAARAAGLHRNSDGILHGAVAWGVALLATALLATSATGVALGSLFSNLSPAGRDAAVASQVMGSVNKGNRQEAINSLQSRLGISSEQASRIVDQALILSGREESASPAGREAAQETVHTAAVASGWLSLALLLSLVAGMGGGVLGARGTRRTPRTVRQAAGAPQQEAVR